MIEFKKEVTITISGDKDILSLMNICEIARQSLVQQDGLCSYDVPSVSNLIHGVLGYRERSK
jgi:hypothetical protein